MRRMRLALLLALCPGVSLAAAPVVDYEICREGSYADQTNGAIAWQSVFLLNDGRIASFGSGWHAAGNDPNSMRVFGPADETCSTIFPWAQVSSPPSLSGTNRYVSTYDNHPSIYIPDDNKVVWAGHGVFDFGLAQWTYGDRSPLTSLWTAYIYDPRGAAGEATTYNPVVGWCSDLHKGAWLGAGGGGYGVYDTEIAVLSTHTGPPWKITYTDLAAQGYSAIGGSARNGGACVGNYFYAAGKKTSTGTTVLYKIDLSGASPVLSATLTGYNDAAGEGFPQIAYDSRRNKLVLIGRTVQEYTFATDTWADVTPGDWPGYTHVMGAFSSAKGKFYFRGIKAGGTSLDSFWWHSLDFGPPSGPDVTPPVVSVTAPSAGSVSGTVTLTASATDVVGVVGVQFKVDGASVGSEDTVAPYSISWDSTTVQNGSRALTAVARDAAGNSATSATVTVACENADQYRLLTVAANSSPFKGPPDTAYGGTKHVNWKWHPVKKRIYTWGGDYGVGASAFGQPDMGSSFVAGSGRTYARDSSLCNDQYSIDPYSSSPAWRLEHPYLPRDLGGGQREYRPGRPDQAALVWDSARSKLWGLYSVLRTEFLYYLADGTTPDLWANGDTTTTGTIEPTGTWSFAPGTSGSPGTWTYETTALLAYRLGSSTYYSGETLITGSGDERVSNWEYDSATDRMYAFGWGRIFIFDPGDKTYEHRVFAPASYSGYFNPCSSYGAVLGNYLYGVALTRTGSTRKSQLIRVHLPNLLALANGAEIPDTATYWNAYELPWSLSTGGVWEASGDASTKWQESAGVEAVNSKIVVVRSIGCLVDEGVTKLTVFDPATGLFAAARSAPESLYATSWEALPDTGEVLFGLTTASYSNAKLWAYKVAAGAEVTPPAFSGYDPANGATGASGTGQELHFYVTDSNSGVDSASISVAVNGGSALGCGTGLTCIGSAPSYYVTYTNPTAWGYSATVTAVLNASDLAHNAATPATYSFTTAAAPAASPRAILTTGGSRTITLGGGSRSMTVTE